MTERRRVLIGVDGSAQSLNAVKYVANLCAPENLEVSLMHVAPVAPLPFVDRDDQSFFIQKMKAMYLEWNRANLKRAESFMGEAKATLTHAGLSEQNVGIILHEQKLGIARDIINEASSGYDSIVIGRTGKGNFQQVHLGGVANKIAQSLNEIPICVVGGGIQSKRVLVAVDGSEHSRRAVQFAARFVARNVLQEVKLIHVLRTFEAGGFADMAAILQDQDIRNYLKNVVGADIGPLIQEYTSLLVQAGVPAAKICNRIVKSVHSRARTIILEARGKLEKDPEGGTTEGYGTIILGRRGMTEIQQFIMGTVSFKVLTEAERHAVWLVA